MKNIIRITHIVVFVLASAVIASIFYEGLVLEWFSFVPILILSMDIIFIISTILNIIYFRKIKVMFYINIFSLVIICLACIFKVLHIEYHKISLLIWDFYILYFYGILVIKKSWKLTSIKK